MFMMDIVDVRKLPDVILQMSVGQPDVHKLYIRRVSILYPHWTYFGDYGMSNR